MIRVQRVAAVVLMLAADPASQLSGTALPASGGDIVGNVVNVRQEPVRYATVQAFRIGEATSGAESRKKISLMRGSGSASTNNEGRFHIKGLPPGEYLVAAQPASWFDSQGSTPPELDATTFFPSTIDADAAVGVRTSAGASTTIRIELVRVPGVRVSGRVVSRSRRPTSGISVQLYHRFGDFGSGASVGVVTSEGTFDIPRVPPGSFLLTVGTRALASGNYVDEFAEKIIEVQARDLNNLVLVLGQGATVAGRIAPEPGTNIPAIGFRVTASLVRAPFAPPRFISATVGDDRSFRLSGLSGWYRLTVSADRPPLVAATRIIVDNRELPAGAEREFAQGNHELVVFVAPRELPKAPVDTTASSGELIERFRGEKVFSRQFDIGTQMVTRRDASVLPALADWLDHDDRHVRGNVAFVFAGLGDPRGFNIIVDTLTDRSAERHSIGHAAVPAREIRQRDPEQIFDLSEGEDDAVGEPGVEVRVKREVLARHSGLFRSCGWSGSGGGSMGGRRPSRHPERPIAPPAVMPLHGHHGHHGHHCRHD